MKGLSSLERIILESLGKQVLAYEEIQMQTGLHQNVCFNVLQALIILAMLCIPIRVRILVQVATDNRLRLVPLRDVDRTDFACAAHVGVVADKVDEVGS